MQHMKTRHGLKKFKCNFCDIVETHIAEFLKLKGEQASSGFWSEQSMEAGHHDFKIQWEKVKVSLNHDMYGEMLFQTVVRYAG